MLPPVVLFSVEHWVLGQRELWDDRWLPGLSWEEDCLCELQVSPKKLCRSPHPQKSGMWPCLEIGSLPKWSSAGEATLGCMALTQYNWCPCKWGMGHATHHVKTRWRASWGIS